MGDGGLALGAAIAAAAAAGSAQPLELDRLDWGPRFEDSAIEAAIRAAGLANRARHEPDLPDRVAQLLAADQVVMWFQGRMEYGPRALGRRSVLARPDRPALRDRLNLVLKRRVWYQPFCPSMLESEGVRLLADWAGTRNRAMTTAHEVKPGCRDQLAGVTSVDGTCRPQFVPDADPDPFAALLRACQRHWGTGAVLNTSYNIHGEPLVCTPAEAIDVFLRSGADALAAGPFLIIRSELDPSGASAEGA
jgi:carbamoyltransferase